MALEGGLSAYACPLGFMEFIARKYAGQVPLILKLNSHESLHEDPEPLPAVTAGIEDALRLGCDAIGFTIYPGSSRAIDGYEQLRELAAEAKAAGLLVVVWSYPRGGDLSSEGETALDVVAYAAQIAAQLGANIIKVKPPSAAFSTNTLKDLYGKNNIASSTLAERFAHVVQSAFAGRRVVIFSGGAKASDQEIIDTAKAIKAGGGFGSIMGRNIFQRPKAEALQLASQVMDIYRG
jgi:class I fructose-bisphosphate aldolase